MTHEATYLLVMLAHAPLIVFQCTIITSSAVPSASRIRAFINVPKDARKLQSKGHMAKRQNALEETLFDACIL